LQEQWEMMQERTRECNKVAARKKKEKEYVIKMEQNRTTDASNFRRCKQK
jgi:hypothetical protein